MSLRLPWALPLRRELDPGVLLVAGSHGIPPTRTRTVRTAEIASQLAGRGVAVDVCILVERALQPMEEDAIVALRSRVRRLELVPHPRIVSRPAALANRAAGLLGRKLGGITHVPWSFVRRLATEYAPKNYRAVIVGGVHLAPCLSVFPDYSERFIDLERIGSDALREHRARGKGEDLAVFGDGKEELELLGACHAVIVTSVVDAVHLRELGFRGDIALAPPLAPARAGRASVPPLRPPRILVVGSASEANIDGINWFRNEVLPAVLETVPSARLRVVGEVARKIEPGVALDRIGWVEDIGIEYRDASLVAIPLRMGSGIRRRAVEAVSHGRALAATLAGARGLGVVAGRDAIVSDDPRELARGIAGALSSDAERRRLEVRSLALAAERFDPGRAHAAVAERMGLPELVVLEQPRVPVSA